MGCTNSSNRICLTKYGVFQFSFSDISRVEKRNLLSGLEQKTKGIKLLLKIDEIHQMNVFKQIVRGVKKNFPWSCDQKVTKLCTKKKVLRFRACFYSTRFGTKIFLQTNEVFWELENSWKLQTTYFFHAALLTPPFSLGSLAKKKTNLMVGGGLGR